MRTMGRPSNYSSDLCERAHNYCLLGATNDELAEFFGVSPRTVDNRIAVHPEFTDAVHRGRAVTDAVVVALCSTVPCSTVPRVTATRSRAPRSIGARSRRSPTRCPTRPTPRPACSGCATASASIGRPRRRRRRRLRTTTWWRCSMPPARACAMPAIERERTLWVRQENDRRKGRKLPAETLLEKPSAFSLSHFWGPLQALIGVSLAEIAETGFRRFRESGHCASMLAERCLVRLPEGHGPSVLPQPCATPRVASGIQRRDLK